ncbi:hypothetical protein V8G54_002093 [Vigna mungo]|uniref:Uncharacterized protein n=1 Tax=Vigna mungo TaxID=3915 RepID=A0AAQ3P909_VIGMU
MAERQRVRGGVEGWCDGSTCAGNWGKEFMEEAREEKMKRSSVDGCRSVSFPRICIWELDGEAGDITCDIVHNAEASLFYRDGTTASESENGGDDIIINNNNGCGVLQKSPCWSLDGSGGEVKKPGQTVSRGHKSYDFILNLQLGIRYRWFLLLEFAIFSFISAFLIKVFFFKIHCCQACFYSERA